MLCAFHTGRVAVDKCKKCSKDICHECLVFVAGQVYCSECAPIATALGGVNRTRDPFLALGLSLICPGMGQVYNGEITKGLTIFLSAIFILPWIYGLFDAFRFAEKINRGQLPLAGPRLSGTFCTALAVAIISSPLIVWNARQHYFELAQIDEKGERTRRKIKRIGEAMEAFARDKGYYPQSQREMYFSKPAYFEEIFCETEMDGFQYNCELNKSGYRIAVLKRLQGGGQKKIILSTGGIIKEE